MKILIGLGKIFGVTWMLIGCAIVGVCCGYIGNASALELTLGFIWGLVTALSGALLYGFARRVA